MNTFKTVVVGVAAGAVFAGAATVLAPLVHADEGTYINQVAARGTAVVAATLPLGHEICAQISEDGPSAMDSIMQAAIDSGITAHDFSVISVTAVYELCPSNVPALHAWLES